MKVQGVIKGAILLTSLMFSLQARPIKKKDINSSDISITENKKHRRRFLQKKKKVTEHDTIQKLQSNSSDTSDTCVSKSYTAGKWFGNVLRDAYLIHRSLIHWDSFKIVASVIPPFIATRMIDEKLQRCFYNAHEHKNKNQLPNWASSAAKWSISVPIIFLGLHAFFEKNDNLRETSRVFLIGMPFVIWTKSIIKKFRFEASLRPWHEKFSREKRASGGFPSGHMAEATYMAVLYGMRFGPKFAVPLGIIAGIVGITFLTGNRHYISQIVAGAGFGAMYALAANKVIEHHLQEYCDIAVHFDPAQGPAVSLSYYF